MGEELEAGRADMLWNDAGWIGVCPAMSGEAGGQPMTV